MKIKYNFTIIMGAVIIIIIFFCSSHKTENLTGHYMSILHDMDMFWPDSHIDLTFVT